MDLAIIGTGLVSPYGLSAREHAFYLPALLPPPAGSPFIGPKDKPVAVEHCRWIGAATPVPDRLIALARRAARDALSPLRDRQGQKLGLLLCSERPRPGLADADLRRLAEAFGEMIEPVFLVQAWGSAGLFAALPAAAKRAQDEGATGFLALAVDSFVSVEYLTHHVEHLPTRWMAWPPPPSEAAAAFVLVDPEVARRDELAIVGTLWKSAAAESASNDENDEPADGVALTELVRKVAGPEVHYVFGQEGVGNLRSREWLLAMARTSARFRAGHDDLCLEASIGSVGAAAGAASVVYGLASLHHRTLAAPWSRSEPFLAWSISRDGTRGMASVTAEGA